MQRTPCTCPTRPLALLLLCCALLAFCTARPAAAYDGYNELTRYDGHFRDFAGLYFGKAVDWRLFKAQAVAESRLDMSARSSAGAVGLMQILPETFQWVTTEHTDHVQGPITEPRWNIAAGIAYDHMLFERWAAIPTVSERVRFMLASYNAGHQAIKDAQLLAAKEGLDPMRWESIQKSLHDVLGRDSQQTIGYVEEILVIFQSLE